MNFKTTILAAATAVAMSTMGAAAATVLNFGTDVTANNLPDGSLDLDFNPPAANVLADDDYSIDSQFNLQGITALRLDPDIFGTGSLTVSTFVDPFVAAGIGAANVLLSLGNPLAPGASVMVQWGTGPTIDISNGQPVNLSTAFSGSGPAFAEDLVFTWTDLQRVQQVSANVAAVPLPAGLLLLTTALGGLGLARRRRKTDA